jgi:hypothetical protein
MLDLLKCSLLGLMFRVINADMPNKMLGASNAKCLFTFFDLAKIKKRLIWCNIPFFECTQDHWSFGYTAGNQNYLADLSSHC